MPEVRCAHDEMVALEKIIPNPRNPNQHPDRQIELLAKIIAAQGWRAPITVSTRSGFIVRGHGRFAAAKQLLCNYAPVDFQDYETEAEEWADLIADNRIAELAEVDDTLLADLLKEIREQDIDIELTGFDLSEIDELLASTVPETAGLTDPDAVPPLPERPITVPGDLWILGRHRLLCGDSTNATDVSRLFGGVTPSLMVTDPPYGVSYDPNWRSERGLTQVQRGKVQNDDRADWSEAWSLFAGDVGYIWHAGRHASTVQDSLERCEFEVRSQIIWAKNRFAISRGNYHWQHEPCWYVVRKGKTGHWNGDRSQTTLWQIESGPLDTGHGTQKPVECMKRPIENNSSPGQAVYDPFLGSGTTLIAAEMTGRVCFGIEILPEYCDVIVKRWQDFTGNKAALDGDGRTFEELTAERDGK